MAASSTETATIDDVLSGFLRDFSLLAVSDRLVGKETIESLRSTMFGAADGRTSLLTRLSDLGLNIRERQAVANALNKASREGRPGVAETAEERAAQVAWLDGHGSSDDAGGAAAADVPSWPPSTRRFLVFTSAGDGAAVQQWVLSSDGERDWELCVVYYGSQSDPACLQVRVRG